MKKLSIAIAAVLTGAFTGPASADIIHADDVIINGGSSSLCVGFDCVNGESFGDTTIRMKENNTRLEFTDTSTGSFPTNDWKIYANDSTNGGSSYLSIYDEDGGKTVFRAYAGAPNNALVIDAQGDIGVGTSTPVTEMHVVDGDSPTLRLEQDGSSGFTAQTWDIAGNETNFFVRDVTSGSKLPFRIFPGSSNDNALIIAASGDVGVGDTTPDADFDITRSGQVTMELQDSSGEAWQYVVDSTGSNAGFSITRVGSGVREFRIDNSGNVYVAGTQVHPDYVFEPDYPLMSLQELAAYVKEHKHLPDVQSAAEVQEHGLNLSALQNQLLKKVEELTLYTIEQQETITELRERLSKLEASEAITP